MPRIRLRKREAQITKGITHEVDGDGAKYTTNDVNLMSDAAIEKYATSEQGKALGADFLGGV
ncbi:MAG: hypothetical protein PHS80_06080 [Methanothrix sp.]|nr:hypothetical protein [Methanothrix sp.]MDD4449001.1 hypothetical protein [Methanothrix sp.]